MSCLFAWPLIRECQLCFAQSAQQGAAFQIEVFKEFASLQACIVTPGLRLVSVACTVDLLFLPLL